MTIVIIGLGIFGWVILMLVVGVAYGERLKASAEQLDDENAVRAARVGIGWPKL
jgi:hypothetical protein